MPNGQDQQQAPQDAARQILDPLGVPRGVKHAAWDAFHNSQTTEQFRNYFDSAPIPQEAKRALWNARWGQGSAAERTRETRLGRAANAVASFLGTQPELSQQGLETMQRPGVTPKLVGAAEYLLGGVPGGKFIAEPSERATTALGQGKYGTAAANTLLGAASAVLPVASEEALARGAGEELVGAARHVLPPTRAGLRYSINPSRSGSLYRYGAKPVETVLTEQAEGGLPRTALREKLLPAVKQRTSQIGAQIGNRLNYARTQGSIRPAVQAVDDALGRLSPAADKARAGLGVLREKLAGNFPDLDNLTARELHDLKDAIDINWNQTLPGMGKREMRIVQGVGHHVYGLLNEELDKIAPGYGELAPKYQGLSKAVQGLQTAVERERAGGLYKTLPRSVVAAEGKRLLRWVPLWAAGGLGFYEGRKLLGGQ